MFASRARRIQTVQNAKGADAFVSTTNPCLDIFTYTSKNFPSEFENFTKLVELVTKAKNSNSELFLKLMKFQRLIEKGNGIKNINYLGMCLLKQEDPETYAKILQWSYAYPKDIMNLCRFNLIFNPISDYLPTSEIDYQGNWTSHKKGTRGSKMSLVEKKIKNILYDPINQKLKVPCEIRIYGDLVIDTFKKVMKGKKEFNPMLLKYMSFETGHWATETNMIWSYIESRLEADDEFVTLVNSTKEINDLGNELRNYLKLNKNGTKWFTNKNRRLIKKIFDSHINLTDNLFKGIHSDGSVFGSNPSRTNEVEMIYQVMKKTPTISLKKLTSTIKRFIDTDEPQNARNQLLIDGYNRYKQALKHGETVAKVNGLDLTSKCWDFFKSSKLTDAELEAQLSQSFNQLRSYLLDSFNADFTFEDFSHSIIPILDISGSMNGTPIQTGLFYFMMMTIVFRVKELYYFETSAQKLVLTDEDIDGTFCNLIKKIYKSTNGSTNLTSVFDMLESENKSDKILMIITDSDCDPKGSNGINPFHCATVPGNGYVHLPSNNYIVVNVKLEKLNFPFIDIDPKVCYVTGNNPKTLNGLIKSMIVSVRNKIPITPDLILNYTLQLDELDLPVTPPVYSNVLNSEEIKRLFDIIQANLPPKPVIYTEHKVTYVKNDDAHDVNDANYNANHNAFDALEDLDDNESVYSHESDA